MKIKKDEGEIKEVLGRLKDRDFSGNAGMAVKNSAYQISTTIVAKGGSLLFTIILARMLLPELFGLYSLALATIALFTSFSDLGVSQAVTTFVAKNIGKKDGKSKAYLKYLLRIKVVLVILSSLALVLTAKFIANTYYNKPIFLALIVGAIYIPLLSFVGFSENIFRAASRFEYPLTKEILFQVSRLILIPLTI